MSDGCSACQAGGAIRESQRRTWAPSGLASNKYGDIPKEVVDASPVILSLAELNRHPHTMTFMVPPIVAPAERMRILNRITEVDAQTPEMRELACALLEASGAQTDREKFQTFMNAGHELVDYGDDPAGWDLYSRPRWTVGCRLGFENSRLTGQRRGIADCEDFSTLFACLCWAAAYACGFTAGRHASLRFHEQDSWAPLNHINNQICMIVEGVHYTPSSREAYDSGCTPAETTVAGARLGETTQEALSRTGWKHSQRVYGAAPTGAPEWSGGLMYGSPPRPDDDAGSVGVRYGAPPLPRDTDDGSGY